MRIRTVKPELFRHEALFEAERDTGLPLRIAFVGLFCAADREGRFKWKPKLLKLDILPWDDCDFSRVLDALTTRGFLVHYESNGELYGAIPSFSKHQIINNREMVSALPEYEKSLDLTTDYPRVPHACPTRADADFATHKGNMEGEYGRGIWNMEGEGNIQSTTVLQIEKIRSRPASKKSTASRKNALPEIVDEDFERFWAAYPKRVGKQAALKAWASVADTAKSSIAEHVKQRALTDRQWLKDHGDFIPLPTTFLNQRRFEDDYIAEKPDWCPDF
jgi:hypothetical protein